MTIRFAWMLVLLPAGPLLAANTPPGAARTEALLDQIDARLRASDSATLALERWCAEQDMADPARITVQRETGAEQPPTAEQRALLGVSAQEPVRYRKVRLVCGRHILSEAENWYVPSRLLPQMNAALDGSDEPFGKVIRPLAPARRTLDQRRLWASDRPAPSCDATAFRHDALVSDGRGRVLALVSEHYRLELVCAARPEAGQN
jgi:chorismate-pyruvate lyase